MRHIKRKNKEFKNLSLEEKQEIENRFEKVNGKQIVGLVRIQHPNEEAFTQYFDEDGKSFVEDDKGKKVKFKDAPKKRRKVRD